MEWDIFLCHASEDKEFVRLIFNSLTEFGLSVWFDEAEIQPGEIFRKEIEYGITHSKYAVAVISENSLNKEWPRMELNQLFVKARQENLKIFPIWYNVTQEMIKQKLPLAADWIGITSKEKPQIIADKIYLAIQKYENEKDAIRPEKLNAKKSILANLISSLKFYFPLIFFTILTSYGFTFTDQMVPKSSTILNELLLIVYFLGVMVYTYFQLRSESMKFYDDKNLNFRVKIVSIIIFLFFIIILDSTLFVSMNTEISIYKFLLNQNKAALIQWTLFINLAFAIVAALTYRFLNWIFMVKHEYNVYKIPLWSSTFTLSILPIGTIFFIFIFIASKGEAGYVFVAIFPLVLSLLAIHGYSHPINRLTEWVARVLLISAIVSCFFGFLLAIGGLIWFLSHEPEAPSVFQTLFSPVSESIDWSKISYPENIYGLRWKEGFSWMVLTGIFFMEMVPGFFTVLTIFHYQITEGKGIVNDFNL